MTTHPALRAELLDDELGVVRSRLGERVMGIERIGSVIRLPMAAPDGGLVFLTLDGTGFDAEPFGLTLTELDGTITPLERWPSGLAPALHPVLNRPFACIRGCAEYYDSHPSRLQERWDAVRYTLRLADLLDHALQRAGRP
jgi:hypothetical protein